MDINEKLQEVIALWDKVNDESTYETMAQANSFASEYHKRTEPLLPYLKDADPEIADRVREIHELSLVFSEPIDF